MNRSILPASACLTAFAAPLTPVSAEEAGRISATSYSERTQDLTLRRNGPPTQSIASLPADFAKGEEGKFSLYADFSGGESKPPLLYLINRTDHAITLPMEDAGLYIKQEARVDGQWVRSEPHVYSSCGMSYGKAFAIPPGHFATPASLLGIESPMTSAVDEACEEMEVRYRFYHEQYHEVISNSGSMSVAHRNMQRANSDEMAIRFGDVEKLAGIASGENEVALVNHRRDLRLDAICKLGTYKDSLLARSTVRSLAEAGAGSTTRAAIGTLADVFPPDEAFTILLPLLSAGEFRERETALAELATLTRKEAEVQQVLRVITADYSNALYFPAFRLELAGQPEKEQRERVKKVTDDAQAPDTIKKQAAEMLEYRFPWSNEPPHPGQSPGN